MNKFGIQKEEIFQGDLGRETQTNKRELKFGNLGGSLRDNGRNG